MRNSSLTHSFEVWKLGYLWGHGPHKLIHTTYATTAKAISHRAEIVA